MATGSALSARALIFVRMLRTMDRLLADQGTEIVTPGVLEVLDRPKTQREAEDDGGQRLAPAEASSGTHVGAELPEHAPQVERARAA